MSTKNNEPTRQTHDDKAPRSAMTDLNPGPNPNPNSNPLGLDGIDFVELTSEEPEPLHRLLLEFGFSRVARHMTRAIDLYIQNGICFLLNRDDSDDDGGSFGAGFARQHGPSICSMGWRVTGDAMDAASIAAKRGATIVAGDFERGGELVPAIRGVGGSLIYLIDRAHSGGGGRSNTSDSTSRGFADARRWEEAGFLPLECPDIVADKGFLAVDHLTNNVEKGTMKQWADFYKTVFGFTELRYFDIRGAKTGLTSFALRSPCGKFCIPINEADEQKSQINEFIAQYHGPGIQHLAFLTNDILRSLARLKGASISFLDIDTDYYDTIWDRVPNVKEDHSEIQRRNVLVDGDAEGYLLQIFTKPLCGPIFIELIQRQNHLSFGEGNFGALFRSIERDQARRGVFQ